MEARKWRCGRFDYLNEGPSAGECRCCVAIGDLTQAPTPAPVASSRRLQAAEYSVVDSGTCADYGFETLTAAECQANAAEFTEPDWQYQDCSWGASGWWTTVPSDCYRTGPSCDSYVSSPRGIRVWRWIHGPDASSPRLQAWVVS